MLQRLSDWNLRWKGLPRKLMLICIVVLICFALLLLFPLVWPFVLALLFAVIMNPLVKLLRRAFAKIKFGGSLATLIGMLLVFGLIGWAAFWLTGRLLHEIVSLARAVPDIIAWLTTTVNGLIAQVNVSMADMLPENFAGMVDSMLKQVGSMLLSFASSVSSKVASGAFATAVSVPQAILSVVLTIMATYYMSSDKDRILAFCRSSLPDKAVQTITKLKSNIFKAVFGQIKSQLVVSLLITITVILGLVIQRQDYALLVGLMIGVADALPIVGAGLFLIPWSIVGFVVGNTALGIGMALLYVATIVVRQIFEPRIVGKNLGLYPLATMMTMYAGLQLVGFWGMLLGPIVLNISKAVLDADSGALKPKKRLLEKK